MRGSVYPEIGDSWEMQVCVCACVCACIQVCVCMCGCVFGESRVLVWDIVDAPVNSLGLCPRHCDST